MWLIAIPIVVIVFFAVYSFVIIPKMTAKEKEKKEKALNDVLQEIAGKEKEAKQNLINDDEHIKHFITDINETDIIGIISCQEKRGTKDFLRQQGINVLSMASKKLVGVKVREDDNDGVYFLVLTNNNIHYLDYTDSGKLNKHLSFQRNNISNIKVEGLNAGDTFIKGAIAGNGKQKLSFEDFDKKKHSFFLYDEFFGHPKSEENNFDTKHIAELNYLFGKPFLDFVNQYKTV